MLPRDSLASTSHLGDKIELPLRLHSLRFGRNLNLDPFQFPRSRRTHTWFKLKKISESMTYSTSGVKLSLVYTNRKHGDQAVPPYKGLDGDDIISEKI
jgi:hypothetical protein